MMVKGTELQRLDRLVLAGHSGLATVAKVEALSDGRTKVTPFSGPAVEGFEFFRVDRDR